MLSWKEKELLWMRWKQNSELNPYSKCFSMIYPDTFLGDQYQQREWGRVDAPLWVQGRALVGETRLQSSWKVQVFSTQKSLTFNHLPYTTWDENNSTYFFFRALA